MPQKRISLQPRCTYHIWTHANGNENLFRNQENYNYFLEKYLHHLHPVLETFAYCLMPNHLHLMVRVRQEKELTLFLKKKKGDKGTNLQGFQNLGGLVSQQFANLFNAYTKAYNKKYNRKGSLFMPNFKRKLIDSDKYFIQLIAYIHKNPIHHGFTKNLNHWPFSSWNAYVLDKLTKVNKEEAMQWFGTLENFEAIHRELNFKNSISIFES